MLSSLKWSYYYYVDSSSTVIDSNNNCMNWLVRMQKKKKKKKERKKENSKDWFHFAKRQNVNVDAGWKVKRIKIFGYPSNKCPRKGQLIHFHGRLCT